MPAGPGGAGAGGVLSRALRERLLLLAAVHRPRGIRAPVLPVRLRDDEPVLPGIVLHFKVNFPHNLTSESYIRFCYNFIIVS